MAQQDSMVVSQVNVTLVSMEKTQTKPQIQTEQLVDVGNLVYTYHLPSDRKDSLRPMKDSSEENDDADDDESQRNEYYNSDRNQEQDIENHQSTENQQENRPKRSASNDGNKHSKKNMKQMKERPRERRNQWANDSEDEKDSSDDYDREYHQPKPTLKNEPEHPFLNYFIGKSIQFLNEFKSVVPASVRALAEEIGHDLEDVNDVPVKYTLRKFNVLARIIRTINAEQIEKEHTILMLIMMKNQMKSLTKYIVMLC